jgi:hypothetical protein
MKMIGGRTISLKNPIGLSMESVYNTTAIHIINYNIQPGCQTKNWNTSFVPVP